MAETSSDNTQPTIKREYSPLGGFLSFLVPGFGQIYQGRIGKGLLFFFCIYLMFFYGMHLGKGRNVFLPRASDDSNPWNLPAPLADLWNRPQFAAQFWVGIVAWPAVIQYMSAPEAEAKDRLFGSYQKEPSEATLNDLQRNSDKLWDLGWVLTVIAGALNVMVIYDAAAGPAFPASKESEDKKEDNNEEASG